MAEARKTERMETRLTPQQKDLIERAAYLEGRSVSDFVVGVLQEAARDTISKHDVLVLGERDRIAFFKALRNPPAPNKALRNAVRNYKKLIRE